MASRTVARLTPRAAASSGSVGMATSGEKRSLTIHRPSVSTAVRAKPVGSAVRELDPRRQVRRVAPQNCLRAGIPSLHTI